MIYHIFTNNVYPALGGVSINTMYHIKELTKWGHKCILYIPWFNNLHYRKKHFHNLLKLNMTKKDHKKMIRQKFKLSTNVKIKFYNAKPFMITIEGPGGLPLQNLEKIVPFNSNLILVDPNLYFFEFSTIDTSHFNSIVSILHTNYFQYNYPRWINRFKFKPLIDIFISGAYMFCQNFTQPNYAQTSLSLKSSDVSLKKIITYSDKVIAISKSVLETYDDFPLESNKIIINNLIGLPNKYFSIKKYYSQGNNKVFFVGKPIISKGIEEFCQIVSNQEVFIFGSKPEPLVNKLINKYNVKWNYKGIWHQKASELKNYFIFLNASISEGVCTTNIEMIALGKFLVLKNHYSNDIFKKFANVYFYDNVSQAKQIIKQLKHKIPAKINSEKLKKEFSYENIGQKLNNILEK